MKPPKGVISAYVRRLKNEVITIDDVPPQAREEVRKAYEQSKALEEATEANLQKDVPQDQPNNEPDDIG